MKKKRLTIVGSLAVDDQLNVFRQVLGHLVHDVPPEQLGERAAMRRAEHENVDAQSSREVKDGGGRILTDTVQGHDWNIVLPAQFQHAGHDLRPGACPIL